MALFATDRLNSRDLSKNASTDTVIENRIFIGGIPANADENEVKNFLLDVFDRKFIKDVKVISDRGGTSKGYGFVTFETKEMAQKILNSADYSNITFKDRKLNISKAVKKTSPLKSSITPITALPSTPPVQYILYTGQNCLDYSQALMTLPQYGYGHLPVYVPGAQSAAYLAPAFNLAGNATTSVANSSQPALLAQSAGIPAIQWPAPLSNQQFPFLSPAASGVPYFNVPRPGNEMLFYNLHSAPTAYNNSITSDYSTCSDLTSLDAQTDMESSPTRVCQSDCFGAAVSYAQTHPLLSYATSVKNAAPASVPQRMIMTAGGQARHEGRGALDGGHD